MLYDKRWDKQTETKADPLSLESLISWLEKQPASKTYDYENCRGKCLYGQYMASHGIRWSESGACGRHSSTQERAEFCDLVYAACASEAPWTFGAALARAREALSSKEL